MTERAETSIRFATVGDIARPLSDKRLHDSSQHSIEKTASIQSAAQLLVRHEVDQVTVTENERPIGCLSRTDIIRAVAIYDLGNHEKGRNNHVPLSETIDVEAPREVFQASFNRCKAKENFAHSFYKRFMGSSDEISKRFAATNMKVQERKIIATLELAADIVVGDLNARRILTEQAERHNRHNLNIQPELYNLWLKSLLETVSEHDPKYNPEVEHSWRLLMGHVIRHMTRRY